jgi:hypothetical protein
MPPWFVSDDPNDQIGGMAGWVGIPEGNGENGESQTEGGSVAAESFFRNTSSSWAGPDSGAGNGGRGQSKQRRRPIERGTLSPSCTRARSPLLFLDAQRSFFRRVFSFVSNVPFPASARHPETTG